jgi:hypothetical protein
MAERSRQRVQVVSTALVGVVMAAVLAGCFAAPPTPSSEAVAPGPVPSDDRAGLEACMAAAGYTVHPARKGSNGLYSWERSSYFTWDPDGNPPNFAASAQCEAQFAPPAGKTDAELREIYDRWVLEAQCLVAYGFHPRPPPSFSEFRDDWRGTGPWMPIDGIPFDRITGEAKDRCGLEMVD